jgi:hypothetical protein
MGNLLEVGDTVIVENALVTSKYKITRVTKTLALSKRPSDGYEHRFYRDTKNKGVAYYKDRFDQNTYSIIKASK